MSWRGVQTQPRGLLGLLQLKNGGHNPSDLEEGIRPALDMLEFLALTDSQIVSGSGTVLGAVAGSFLRQPFTAGILALPIPQNEVWYVWNATVLISMATTEYAEGLGMSYSSQADPTSAVQLITNNRRQTMSAVTGTASIGAQVRRLFGPGTTFYLQLLDYANGANRAFGGYLEITRMSI